MIPRSLQLSGFLSYRQPTALDFTTFSLACISGPNGAGKSSLLDAITWALFGQARKRDDSLINNHPDVSAAEVTFEFEYERNVYRIQRTARRGKTNLLEFQLLQSAPPGEAPAWKPLTGSSQRETQERIQQILRMEYDTFINASFFLQGKADQFTQQRPGDRKRILGNILGLDAWEGYRQRSAEWRRAVEEQVNTLQGQLKEILSELEEEPVRKERLQMLESELQRLAETRQMQETLLDSLKQAAAALEERRKMVQDRQRQAEGAARRLQEVYARLEARKLELETYTELLGRAGQIQSAYAAWQAAREELASWEERAERFRQMERRLQEPQAEITAARSRLEQELEGLAARQVESEQAQAKLPEVQVKLEQTRLAVAEAEIQLQQRNLLELELIQARLRLAEARAENPRLRLEMDELKAHLETLKQPGEVVCPFCGQRLNETDRLRLVDSLEIQGREKGDRFRQNKALLEKADQLVNELDQQMRALSHAQASYLAASRSFEQLSAQVNQWQEQYAAWEAEGRPRIVEIEHLLQEGKYAPASRHLVAGFEAELQELGYDPQAHEAARQAEADGRQADLDLRELEKAQASNVSLDREIQDLTSQWQVYRLEAEQLQTEYNNAAASLSEAEQQAPDIQLVEEQLYQSQEHENQLRLEVGAARQKVEVLGDLKVRRRDLEAERESLEIQIARYRQLESAFGHNGVPALLIEQALPQIEARANHILDRLSGGGMYVRFVTQEAYKDKRREDLRETLDIEISDASGSRDYELYSGGEAFRVNFAVRLALSEVLAQRSGARLQMLVIDEGFGSQDAQGRQRLIEAINLVKDDFDTILVITHIEELKDAFPHRIEVEKTAEGSLLRVI
jgi:DNA repair protein SbcC/Rad50